MADDSRDEIVRNFYRVRQALGYLGLTMPVILIVGGLLAQGTLERSISDYYYTVVRDVLVGNMVAIGIFLICYTGFRRDGDERFSDDLITTVAGLAALVIAFFPNMRRPPPPDAAIPQILFGQYVSAIIHYSAAIVFLLCLGWMCAARFARTAKPARRRIYRASGRIIFAMTGVVFVASWFKVNGPAAPQRVVNDYALVLWAEVIGISSFSVSWLVKGRADMSLLSALDRLRRMRERPGARPMRADPDGPAARVGPTAGRRRSG